MRIEPTSYLFGLKGLRYGSRMAISLSALVNCASSMVGR